MASIIDITKRLKIESRFQKAIEAAPIAIVMINRKREIIMINLEAKKLFGYQDSEISCNRNFRSISNYCFLHIIYTSTTQATNQPKYNDCKYTALCEFGYIKTIDNYFCDTAMA
jgi:PAS domain-containing protein